MSVADNNKRIAKNTIALYFRTFITMVVGLYTGRIMLQALGVENYGINAVIGGIIGMSTLITSAMSAAISRYITYAIGEGDKERLNTMFSTSVNAQIVMSLIAIVVMEVGGLWFLNTQASIPFERLETAQWVLHCSIITLAISLISSPFNALIIAHERMGIYAYMSIVDVTLKLLICYAIMAFDGDRLILLAVLQIVVALIMQCSYGWYCGRHFEEAHYSPKVFDKKLLIELTTFSGWSLMNNGAYVFSTQGVNMLVNVFFGVVFNASRSLAITVNSAIQGFVGNFTMAFAPQITKSYASGDKEYAIKLVNKGTKFSWMMMFIFIVPVCMEAEMLLKLWLGEVPVMAPLFLQFAMFESLSVSSGQNLFRLIQADGRIKRYTVHAAITAGLIFPLVWVAFYLGAPVWVAYVIFIFIFFALNIVRFYDIKRLMTFSVRQHIRECYIPCITVSVTSFIVPVLLSFVMQDGILRFFAMSIVSVSWTCLCCVVFGLSQQERGFLWEKVKGGVGRFILKRK